ncbi:MULTISPECIES: glycosyltransferase [unclassified Streptomyces]|uniref:glycosyltransferase n=1 Tax=unclassified Streptomyces TaxID=2593676 RepID=UPI002E29367D|nr:glycosyltransferase [Streptomyces sp. NBC_00441]
MTHLLSLITPVHRAGLAYLRETYDSLAGQVLPEGWEWEWLIQEDGAGVGAAEFLPDDPRIKVASSRRGGPHVSQTVALGRSYGELVKTLDADDLLTDGALARDIRVLTERPEVGWVTSAVLDLMPDGSRVGFPDPAEGPVEPGDVLAHWELHHRAQVHPATLCVRRQLIVALGGWTALPASGDTGLLLGLDAFSPGWFLGEVGLLYRKHDGQITTDPAHAQGPEWDARMRIIGERARAFRELFGAR